MTRKKVQLAFITNYSARKATYKKRKNGLLKKVHEISTLCGVDACAIIYGPYEAQPVLWPPSDVGVQCVLGRFRRMPEMDQSKKMVNQETFLRERIAKIKDQLKKLIKDNREKEINEVMFQCLIDMDISNMSLMDFNDLVWHIDTFTRNINMTSEKLMREGANVFQANISGPGLVEETKPPTPSVNPSTVIPAGGLYAFHATQNQANWFFPKGLVNTYGSSSSNNLPYLLPVVNTSVMPPPQFDMGGFVFNSGVGASSSENPPWRLPAVRNDMMPPPPQPQFNVGGFVNNIGVVASSSKNPPSGISDVSHDTMMPPPPDPAPLNRDGVFPQQP